MNERYEQSWKALRPMLVTVFGNVIETKAVAFWKALTGIDVTLPSNVIIPFSLLTIFAPKPSVFVGVITLPFNET